MLTALFVVALIMAALFALGAGAAWARERTGTILATTAALSGLGALSVLTGLVAGQGSALLAVPLGLPRGTIVLVLDPLSCWFLLLLFIAAAACAIFALETHAAEDARSTPFFPLFVAAMALILIAGDAYALVFGFELMSLTSWAMVLWRHEEEALR
ncbi:MAG: hydrogenase 4 subunit B, partial [Acetobacteraceae bacterium]|nr:hydrogenase 4 subunit B [Acetobacteraceae bacterium]